MEEAFKYSLKVRKKLRILEIDQGVEAHLNYETNQAIK